MDDDKPGPANSESSSAAGVPALINDDDRQVLAWVAEQIHATGRAPQDSELLIQFRRPESALIRWRSLRLLSRSGDRLLPSRNGLRILASDALRADLPRVAGVLEAAKEVWLTTRQERVSLEHLAAASGLDLAVTQRVVSLGPLVWSADPQSGMPITVELGDHVLEVQSQVCSSRTWEFIPPRSELELLDRIAAGERVFPYVAVCERLVCRALGDIYMQHGFRDLADAEIRGGELRSFYCQQSRLDRIVFENTTLWGSLFYACSFKGAKFLGVHTAQLSLIGCDLEDVVVAAPGLPGALVDQSSFSTSTNGLIEHILAVTYWSTVRVDGQWVDRAWLAEQVHKAAPQEPRTATAAETEPAGEENGSAETPDEGAEPTASRRVADPTPRPRLQLRTGLNPSMFDVVFDDEVVAAVNKSLVGARLLALITEHPKVDHHVLDLLSVLNGGVSELYTGTSKLSDIRALAARLGIQQSIPGEITREQTNRTGALLRRLEVVRAEIQAGSTRKKREWSAEREEESIVRMLGIANYLPSTYGDGSDPIGGAQGRLRRVYSTVLGQLQSQHSGLRDHLNASVRSGEFWAYEY